MAVTIDGSRKAINVAWDETALAGDLVDLKAEAPNGDVSTRPQIQNDGHAVVTYPADYHGESRITITDEDGATETGTIEV